MTKNFWEDVKYCYENSPKFMDTLNKMVSTTKEELKHDITTAWESWQNEEIFELGKIANKHGFKSEISFKQNLASCKVINAHTPENEDLYKKVVKEFDEYVKNIDKEQEENPKIYYLVRNEYYGRSRYTDKVGNHQVFITDSLSVGLGETISEDAIIKTDTKDVCEFYKKFYDDYEIFSVYRRKADDSYFISLPDHDDDIVETVYQGTHKKCEEWLAERNLEDY